MAAKPSRVELVVSRWGNSLAVRLPAESARAIGVAEGDKLLVELPPDGRLVLTPARKIVDRIAMRKLRRFVASQKETPPVVGDMRRKARY